MFLEPQHLDQIYSLIDKYQPPIIASAKPYEDYAGHNTGMQYSFYTEINGLKIWTMRNSFWDPKMRVSDTPKDVRSGFCVLLHNSGYYTTLPKSATLATASDAKIQEIWQQMDSLYYKQKSARKMKAR